MSEEQKFGIFFILLGLFILSFVVFPQLITILIGVFFILVSVFAVILIVNGIFLLL